MRSHDPPLAAHAAYSELSINRGPGWESRAREGQSALLHIAPELQIKELWQS